MASDDSSSPPSRPSRRERPPVIRNIFDRPENIGKKVITGGRDPPKTKRPGQSIIEKVKESGRRSGRGGGTSGQPGGVRVADVGLDPTKRTTPADILQTATKERQAAVAKEAKRQADIADARTKLADPDISGSARAVLSERIAGLEARRETFDPRSLSRRAAPQAFVEGTPEVIGLPAGTGKRTVVGGFEGTSGTKSVTGFDIAAGSFELQPLPEQEQPTPVSGKVSKKKEEDKNILQQIGLSEKVERVGQFNIKKLEEFLGEPTPTLVEFSAVKPPKQRGTTRTDLGGQPRFTPILKDDLGRIDLITPPAPDTRTTITGVRATRFQPDVDTFRVSGVDLTAPTPITTGTTITGRDQRQFTPLLPDDLGKIDLITPSRPRRGETVLPPPSKPLTLIPGVQLITPERSTRGETLTVTPRGRFQPETFRVEGVDLTRPRPRVRGETVVPDPVAPPFVVRAPFELTGVTAPRARGETVVPEQPFRVSPPFDITAPSRPTRGETVLPPVRLGLIPLVTPDRRVGRGESVLPPPAAPLTIVPGVDLTAPRRSLLGETLTVEPKGRFTPTIPKENFVTFDDLQFKPTESRIVQEPSFREKALRTLILKEKGERELVTAFTVGELKEIEDRPLQAGGLFLLGGATGKAFKFSGRFAKQLNRFLPSSKFVTRPVGVTVAGGLGGLFAGSVALEVAQEPGVLPKVEQLGRETTKLAAFSAGLKASQVVNVPLAFEGIKIKGVKSDLNIKSLGLEAKGRGKPLVSLITKKPKADLSTFDIVVEQPKGKVVLKVFPKGKSTTSKVPDEAFLDFVPESPPTGNIIARATIEQEGKAPIILGEKLILKGQPIPPIESIVKPTPAEPLKVLKFKEGTSVKDIEKKLIKSLSPGAESRLVLGAVKKPSISISDITSRSDPPATASFSKVLTASLDIPAREKPRLGILSDIIRNVRLEKGLKVSDKDILFEIEAFKDAQKATSTILDFGARKEAIFFGSGVQTQQVPKQFKIDFSKSDVDIALLQTTRGAKKSTTRLSKDLQKIGESTGVKEETPLEIDIAGEKVVEIKPLLGDVPGEKAPERILGFPFLDISKRSSTVPFGGARGTRLGQQTQAKAAASSFLIGGGKDLPPAFQEGGFLPRPKRFEKDLPDLIITSEAIESIFKKAGKTKRAAKLRKDIDRLKKTFTPEQRFEIDRLVQQRLKTTEPAEIGINLKNLQKSKGLTPAKVAAAGSRGFEQPRQRSVAAQVRSQRPIRSPSLRSAAPSVASTIRGTSRAPSAVRSIAPSRAPSRVPSRAPSRVRSPVSRSPSASRVSRIRSPSPSRSPVPEPPPTTPPPIKPFRLNIDRFPLEKRRRKQRRGFAVTRFTPTIEATVKGIKAPRFSIQSVVGERTGLGIRPIPL